MITLQTRDKIDTEVWRQMTRHFITGAIEWKLMLTPVGSMWRSWKFDGGQTHIEYLDIYVFGIRVVRWRV